VQISDIVALEAGAGESVALCANGNVYTWGRGDLTAFRAFENAIAIAAGRDFTLFLRNDGTVWGWGNNLFWTLGNASTVNNISTPTQLPGLYNITAIAAGSIHALALDANGNVWAWGLNPDGQLGNGTLESSRAPVQVQGLTDIIQISASTAVGLSISHSVALRSDGTVWGWGSSAHGRLGNDGFGAGTRITTPVQAHINNVVSVGAGGDNTMAVRADGTIWAWGASGNGSLGNGAGSGTPHRWVPGQVLCPAGIGGFSLVGDISVPLSCCALAPGCTCVTDVTIAGAATRNLTAGSTLQLTATLNPTNATNRNVTWHSSNTAIATVSTNGLITARAAGTATITVTTADGNHTANVTVNVTLPTPTDVSIAGTATRDVIIGDAVQLSTTVTPTYANQSVTWTSNNAEVATVSANGLVTARAVGTATITASSATGNRTAIITFHVISGNSYIFSTRWLSNFFNWLLFFLGFGWIWMWF